MEEYIKKKELIRKITCNMAEFIGEPDDVQKHDEQCNYAICMIEEASVADVAPVVHAQWIKRGNKYQCTHCKVLMSIDGTPKENLLNYCPNCGAKMESEE